MPPSCFEPLPGVGAFHEEGRLVDAAQVGSLQIQHLDPPVAAVRVAQVHLVEVPREEVRLLAALGAADLDDDVASVVRVAGHQQPAELRSELGDVLLRLGELRLAQARARRAVRHRTISRAAATSSSASRRARIALTTGSSSLDGAASSSRKRLRSSVMPASDSWARTFSYSRSSSAKRSASRHVSRLPQVGDGLRPAVARQLRFLRPRAVAALEALDATTGVDELLLARVEGVALVAELDMELGLGRTGS